MSELLKPPAIPSAILNFFSTQPDFPAVAGDMAEEFQQRAQSLGARAAKLWYWRESLRNAWALTARELYRTPVRTMVIALGGFIAVSMATGLYVFISFYPLSVRNFLGGYFDPMELVLNPIRRDFALLLQFIASFAAGWIGGKLLPGREWALALMFALILACTGLLALRIVLPTPMWEFMIAASALRLSGFWAGSLWIRRSIQRATGGAASTR